MLSTNYGLGQRFFRWIRQKFVRTMFEANGFSIDFRQMKRKHSDVILFALQSPTNWNSIFSVIAIPNC